MNCPNCGSEPKNNATFCTSCGTRLEPAQTEQTPQTEQAPQAEQTPPDLQPPSVDTIPAPPQMPDLPTPPEIPAQAQVEPPAIPPQETQPPATPPPEAYTPQQPPQQNYQQGQYQQPPPPPPEGQKKSKTGLIVGIVGVVVVLMAISIGAAILVTGNITSWFNRPAPPTIPPPTVVVTPEPTPEPTHEPPVVIPGPGPAVPPVEPVPLPEPIETPPAIFDSDQELVGLWAFESGEPVYFFGLSEYIMFIDYGDGTFGVYESQAEEWGFWHIDSEGMLIVEGTVWIETYEFTFEITGSRLTIIDEDGDTIHYQRLTT